MEYKYLGNSGLKVSAISFGLSLTGLSQETMNSTDFDETRFMFMDYCIKSGINHFDTSEIYGYGKSESLLGKHIKQGNWDLDELVIATKFAPLRRPLQGNNRKTMRYAFENSLSKLQLDHIDLIYLHRIDYSSPLFEQVSAINEFIENDKAFYWGTSEFTAAEINEIFFICEKYGYSYPIVEQCQYNMLCRKAVEVELVPLFENYHLGTAVWSPAAGGILSGRFNDGSFPTDSKLANHFFGRGVYSQLIDWRDDKGAGLLQGIKKIADDLGCTQSQLALAWVLHNKDVSTALVGASKLEHIEDNIKALEVVKKLDSSTLDKIETVLNNRPTPQMDFRKFQPKNPRR